MPLNEPARVSVIVPCRNEIRCIGEFLESLLGQELAGIDLEILIADGMSVDGTRLVLREFQKKYQWVKVLDNPEQIVSTGLNRAILEARGEIIVRMDVHTIYASNYLKSCVEVLRETGAGNVGGPALTRAEGYWQQAVACAFHTPFASGGAKFRNPRYEGPVDTVSYGCWRKSTLERIGLFDESQVRSQDDELNRRLASCGGIVWQSPKIVSWYRPRASLPALFTQYFQYGFWKVAVIRKHPNRLAWRNLMPASCLLAFLVLAICSAAAGLANFTAWRNAFLGSLGALSTLYAASCLAAAIFAARSEGWKLFPALPIVFATYHLSYALGFLLAVFSACAVWLRPNFSRKVLALMSR